VIIVYLLVLYRPIVQRGGHVSVKIGKLNGMLILDIALAG
jgi:hypothetical protein